MRFPGEINSSPLQPPFCDSPHSRLPHPTHSREGEQSEVFEARGCAGLLALEVFIRKNSLSNLKQESRGERNVHTILL